MKIFFSIITTTFLLQQLAMAQPIKLSDILDSIEQSHPSVKMYDAEIQSMDAMAKGAQNWMAPEISSGFWMTPYNVNLWKKDGADNTGMGQYMISASQMFPNRKFNNANEKYLRSLSSAEAENKKSTINELFAAAKENYNSWIIIEKKLMIINESEKLLQLIITNAETRYKNGLGKVSAYYKAKAAQGNVMKMRVMLQNEIMQKRIALNTLMNRNRLIEFSIDTNYSVTDFEHKTFDSTLFFASRSDLKAIDQNIQLAYLKQEIEKQSLRPQYGVQFAHMFGFGGFPQQFTLMGTMKIPFAKWSSKESIANIESLKWKAVSLQNQKQVMANEYSGMAYALQQSISAKKNELQLFENNIIPALRKNYQSMLLAYEQNTEELFDLYDAWETLNNTQLQYLDQLEELLDMQVNLEKLLQIK